MINLCCCIVSFSVHCTLSQSIEVSWLCVCVRERRVCIQFILCVCIYTSSISVPLSMCLCMSAIIQLSVKSDFTSLNALWFIPLSFICLQLEINTKINKFSQHNEIECKANGKRFFFWSNKKHQVNNEKLRQISKEKCYQNLIARNKVKRWEQQNIHLLTTTTKHQKLVSGRLRSESKPNTIQNEDTTHNHKQIKQKN